MPCSPTAQLERLATALAQGAALELYLTPKPGLVDLADRGSHPDLSLAIMERSVQLVGAYLDEQVRSLVAGEPFICQKNIAIRAERRLLDELGTNTHKGYIFLSGMLLIARWQAASPDENAIRRRLSALASDFFKAGEEEASHGRRVREKYRTGGIVLESIHGFPSVFEAALPAFRESMKQKACFTAASFAMLARLMQTVDDTTTLHRGGPPGLARVKQDGRRLERMIADGGDYIGYLRALNRSYVRINLTMGGIADMLGLAYGWLIAGGEISEVSLDRADAEHLLML
ncbi:MAG TPA: triphosphoribosyl-dephospho-CoA synthase [Azonexus sp.]|nr:triphosphoribosyl-dephospho-CoA synthase [Azonexus sp.]